MVVGFRGFLYQIGMVKRIERGFGVGLFEVLGVVLLLLPLLLLQMILMKILPFLVEFVAQVLILARVLVVVFFGGG